MFCSNEVTFGGFLRKLQDEGWPPGRTTLSLRLESSHTHSSHFMGRKLNRQFYYRQYFSILEDQNVSVGFCFLSALPTLSPVPCFSSQNFLGSFQEFPVIE